MFIDIEMATEDFDSRTRISQRQTILDLYNSAIPTEIISFQLDISEEEVENIIEEKNYHLKGHHHQMPLLLWIYFISMLS